MQFGDFDGDSSIDVVLAFKDWFFVHSLRNNEFTAEFLNTEMINTDVDNNFMKNLYDEYSSGLIINYLDNDADGDIMIPTLSLSYDADNGIDTQSFSGQTLVLDKDSSFLVYNFYSEERKVRYHLTPEIFKEHFISAFDTLGAGYFMQLNYSAVFELSDGSSSDSIEFNFTMTSSDAVNHCYDPESIFFNSDDFSSDFQFDEDSFDDNDGQEFYHLGFPYNYYSNQYLPLNNIAITSNDSTLDIHYLGYDHAENALVVNWNEHWFGQAEVMVVTNNSPADLIWWIEECSWVPNVDWSVFSGVIDTNYYNLTVLPINDDPRISLMGFLSTNIFNEIVLEPFTGVGGDSVYNIDEDNSLGLYYKASDVDDSTIVLGYTVVEGEFTIDFNNDSILTVNPSPDWNGLGQVALTATDTSGATFSKMLYLEVNPINDSPTISSISDTTINEDQILSLSINKNDIESEYLIVEVSMSDNIQTFLFDNGDSIMFVPDHNWNGSEQFTISVFDTDGLSDETNFDILVMPVDDEPEVNTLISDVYFYEDFLEPWYLDLSSIFVDIDGELDYSVNIIDSTVVNTEIIGNNLNLYPLLDSYGVTDIIVKASNPTRASIVDTFTVTIFNVNDGPFIGSLEALLTTEGNPIILPSIFSMDTAGVIYDLDNSISELSFNLSIDNGIPASIEWDGDLQSQPVISFIDSNYYGNFSVNICVADEQFEECGDISIIVSPINDAPFFVDGIENTIGLNVPFNIEIDIADIDSDTLILSLLSSFDYPEWFNLSGNNASGIADSLDSIILPLELSDGIISIVDSIKLHVENFVPKILDIRDIPNDQGGRVYIVFKSSYFDDGSNDINYGVYREDTYLDTMSWVGLNSLNGTGEYNYVYEVSTLYDSTINSAGISNFKVVAHTENGIYHSESHSGYSLDNIAPSVPIGVLASNEQGGIFISWYKSNDDDFQYFQLEKSSNADFIESEIEVIQTIDSMFIDFEYAVNQSNFYRIRTFDYSGNASDYSDIISAIVLSTDPLSLIPDIFALHQNYPNPFNPTTSISYDLPANEFVSINVFDLVGREVKTLVNKNQVAGFRSVQWNATNNLGQPVSAGMYIYTIQAGEFRQTKKMVLLK